MTLPGVNSANAGQIDWNGFAVPGEIAGAIRTASARTGADFAVMMEKAAVESSFRPELSAKTSSATGLYQFIEGTWLSMVKKHGAEHGLAREAAAISVDERGRASVSDPQMRDHILGLRTDPAAAAAMAGEYMQANAGFLEDRLGRKPDATELYLAHFLGPSGAVKFIDAHQANPAANAAAMMPAAASANKNVFYDRGTGDALSLDQVRARFAEKFGAGGDDARPVAIAGADQRPVRSFTPAPAAMRADEPVAVTPLAVMILASLDRAALSSFSGADNDDSRSGADQQRREEALRRYSGTMAL